MCHGQICTAAAVGSLDLSKVFLSHIGIGISMFLLFVYILRAKLVRTGLKGQRERLTKGLYNLNLGSVGHLICNFEGGGEMGGKTAGVKGRRQMECIQGQRG